MCRCLFNISMGRKKARNLLFCHLVDILSLVLLSIKGALGLPWWLSGKESVADAGDAGLIPGSGISHGEGNGNPLQCSCLESPRDGGAWWAAVYGVAQSRTRLK